MPNQDSGFLIDETCLNDEVLIEEETDQNTADQFLINPEDYIEEEENEERFEIINEELETFQNLSNLDDLTDRYMQRKSNQPEKSSVAKIMKCYKSIDKLNKMVDEELNRCFSPMSKYSIQYYLKNAYAS